MLKISRLLIFIFSFAFVFNSCNIEFFNPFMGDSYKGSSGTQVALPLMSPAGGVYGSDQTVTITCATSGAIIHYTTDGSDPNIYSLEYSSGIIISGDGTNLVLKAFAEKIGMTASAIRTNTYTINYSQVSTPAINPIGGTYDTDLNVSITCDTTGAAIRYTTDGSNPNGSSPVYSDLIPIAGNGTTMAIKAYAIKTGMMDSTLRTETYTIAYAQVAAPEMNPAGGTYDTDQNISISCATGGVTIRYTTDGSTPNGLSPVYTGPISVAGNGTTRTIKAFAAKPGMTDSAITTEVYTVSYAQVATPVMNPAGGTYATDQNVSIGCATTGVTIRYTTDGSIPNGSSPAYTGPISVAGNGTNISIKAFATKAGMTDSSIGTEVYTISYNQVATPVMNPAGGTYAADQNVSIGCATTGVTIRYTTDGSIPNGSSPAYTGPISVAGNGTNIPIKAFATKAGMTDSSVRTETYTIAYAQVATPTMSPTGGTYTSDQSISISCSTGGATIRYTTDGTDPNGSSPVYSSPIPVAGNGTNKIIKAFAEKAGMTASAIRTESYTIGYNTVDAPMMNPAGGTYGTDQNVAISCSTGGATIRYTTDGSDPNGFSQAYSTSIPVSGSGSMTIKAFAEKAGMTASAITTEIYTIIYNQVDTPFMNPTTGTYNSDQSVTISCGTAGATIRYTTDNSSPNAGSPVYSTPISVAGHGTTMTIKAYATKASMTDSTVKTETYSILYDAVNTPVTNPPGGTYGSDQNVSITCGTAGATIRYTIDGTDPNGSSPVYSTPIAVAGHGTNVTIKTYATKAGMAPSPISSAPYTIQYPQIATPVMNPTSGTYTTDQNVSITCGTTGAIIRYTTDGSIPNPSSPVYSTPITVAGNGTNLTIKAYATKAGMLDSSVASQSYSIQYVQAATPVINPTGGTYSTDQSVSITCGTTGATIRYTTNGSIPNESSTVYASPISVAGNGTNMTIKAIAIKAGMLNSNVGSESYTIQYVQVATPVMNPAGGTYGADQSVAITCSTTGATIRYTTDGSIPNESSTAYASPISVAGNGTNMTIKAIAIKVGMLNSNVASESYTIQYVQVATPVMNPAGGTYGADQSVAITCSTTGATIRYTTNGSIPNASSAVYSSPISVAGDGTSMTIKAYATYTGMVDSAVASETYSISYSQVATPVLSPPGGTYDTDINVTISCATTGATIRYTVNGSTPNTSSPLFTAPVSIVGDGTSITIKAYAYKTGMANSAVATETYTIVYSTPTPTAIPTPTPALPTGKYPGYVYIRPIDVTESSGNNLTDHQVLVTLNTGNFNYSHVLAANGNDIRFNADDVEYSYWIETWNTGGESKIWVKVPSIPSGQTKVIYMFYGYASATQASNGDNTFILFDDFNDNSLNTAKWTDMTKNPAAVSEESQQLLSKMSKTKGYRGWLRSKNQISESNIALHFTTTFQSTQAGCVATIHFDGTTNTSNYDYPANGFSFDWSTQTSGGKFLLDSFTGGTGMHLGSYLSYAPDTNPHTFELRYYNQSLYLKCDGYGRTIGTSAQTFTTKYVGFAGRETFETNSTSDTYFDNVFVRKLVSPEPGIYIWPDEANPQ